ncbi:MAG: hypothetical protein KatS3mg008_0236 [Acidimicrobiales bacterium]|nr:MAG: hypothetical protein KatS3mg008_0236 [Acidimicrobiales bacterium]
MTLAVGEVRLQARGSLELIWGRLARPFDPAEVVEALLGVSLQDARGLVGVALATSREAEELLRGMNASIRGLVSSTTASERCLGEVRGPVLWSETASARGSSHGAEDLFVCLTPTRAYDTPENRMVVAALDLVWHAAREARHDSFGGESRREEAYRRGEAARRWLQYPTLRGVPPERPRPRTLQRVRKSKRRWVYEPALALLEKAQVPLEPEELVSLADVPTLRRWWLLAEIVATLESVGRELPPFRVEDGVLLSGPVLFRHPTCPRGVERGFAGVMLGTLVADVALDDEREDATALIRIESMAGGRPCMLVRDRRDVERVVEIAYELARQ